jgi:hypothetical protein
MKSLFFIRLPNSKSETDDGTENNPRQDQRKKRQHAYRKIVAASAIVNCSGDKFLFGGSATKK